MFSDGFRDMDSHDTTKMPQMSDTEEERHYTNDTDAPLYEPVIGALSNIFDPEIPVNIYDLGLIYSVNINTECGDVKVCMTLTAPGCPVAQTFPGTVETALRAVPGVSNATVELVWEPAWTRDRMSDAAKLELGML
jgi:FeS assembly SUF system protein